jgi:hypothetical protein
MRVPRREAASDERGGGGSHIIEQALVGAPGRTRHCGILERRAGFKAAAMETLQRLAHVAGALDNLKWLDCALLARRRRRLTEIVNAKLVVDLYEQAAWPGHAPRAPVHGHDLWLGHWARQRREDHHRVIANEEHPFCADALG